MRRGNKKQIFLWGGIIKSILILALLMAGLSLNVLAEEGSSTVTVRFVDAYGGNTGISAMSALPGQTIKLPAAPADKGVSAAVNGSPAWKPVQGKTDTFLKSAASLTYEQIKTLCGTYGSGSTLTLYSTRALSLTFNNYDGTNKFVQRYYYEGTTATLSGSPNKSNSAYKGWTTVKSGNAVTYQFSQKVEMKEDLDLYLVTYMRVRYYGRNGSRLYYTGYYKRGTTITLAAVPALNKYRSLGWSTNKNASTASYTAGTQMKIYRDLNFYAIYKYTPYTVKFTDNSGKDVSAGYKNLYLNAAKGETITLPQLPSLKNYISVGWAEASDQTEAAVKAGEKVRINGNITYYAVYRSPRKLKMTFVDMNGSVTETFSALNKTVTEGNTFTLPPVPEKEGSFPVCWRLNVKGTIKCYDAGTKIRASGNCRFYAFYKQRVQVILHYNNGQIFRTDIWGKGMEYTLPTMENEYGNSFMGWGTKAGITLSQSRPCKTYYEPDTPVVINNTKHFYAVVMRRSEEPNLSKSQLYGSASPDTSAYKRIIFVGDSRTSRLKLSLTNRGIDFSGKNVCFVHKSGSSVEWLETDGYKQLLNIIAKDGTQDTRPTAIIFNSGVNGLKDYSAYVTFYKKAAPTLKEKNCRLYLMAVNPINSAMINKIHFIPRQPSQIKTFNEYLKTNLAGDYTYIDTYTWLMQTGFSTDRGDTGYDTGVDDGLHYTVRTYQRIYLRCLQTLANTK